MSDLGDAQIKNLLDRFDAHVRTHGGGGGGGGGVTGEVIVGGYQLINTGWQRMSANASLPAGSQPGREIVIEVHGYGFWRNAANTNLSFGISIAPTVLPALAEAKIVGTTMPDALEFAFHVVASITVLTFGTAEGHVSFSAAPRLQAGGGAGMSSPQNSTVAEGHEPGMNYVGGVGTNWFISAAWQAGGGTSAVVNRTQITYY